MQEIYNKFNILLGEFGEIVIAGGCVRDYLMGKSPKDYDVFILNSEIPQETLNTLVKTKLESEKFPRLESEVSWHRSEPFLIETINAGALIHDKQGIMAEAQILFSHYKSAEELIDSFDWNVCLFGWGRNGLYQKESIENIGSGKELKLNRITFPLSTLRRGFRFSERFLMKLRSKDLADLTYLVHCQLNKL